MPFVHLISNATRGSQDTDNLLRELTKTLSLAVGFPEATCMVQLTLGQDMSLGGSTEPCAFVEVRCLNQNDAEVNAKSIALFSATVTKELGIPAARIFVNLVDVVGANVGVYGMPLPLWQKSQSN